MNCKYVFLIILIAVIAGIPRLYHLENTIMFLSDQGRDALIAKRIMVDHNLTLLGPITSVGNMYLGPFYYYFMLPWLWLTYPNPIGPAYAIAITGIITAVLVYVISSKIFNQPTGFFAGLFYALMPVSVEYNRFSWNPNLAPLISILLFYFLVKWYLTPKFTHTLILSILFGILIQLHYVTLTVLGVIFFVMLVKKTHFYHYAIFLIGVILSLSPLIAFDFRHQHLISQRFFNFFTSSEHHLNSIYNFPQIIKDTEGRLFKITTQLPLNNKINGRDAIIAYIFIASIILLLFKLHRINTLEKAGFLILILWIGFAILGTAFYQSGILDHYLTYCFPIIVIIWTYLLNKMYLPIFITISILICIYFTNILIHNSYNGTGLYVYNEAVKTALPYIRNNYNIALLSTIPDYQGLNYRYFFETSDKPPNFENDYHNLSQLIIIDEVNTTDPLSIPFYEIQTPNLRTLKYKLMFDKNKYLYIYEP